MDPRKDSVLERDAEIFKKRDDDRGKKWKELSKEEKKVIFKQYYLKITVVIVLIVGIAVYMIVNNILHPKPKVKLGVTFLNVYSDIEKTAKLKDETINYLKLDKKKETVSFENFGNTQRSEVQVKYSTLSAAGQLDYVIEDAEKYEKEVSLGVYYPLDDWLTDDMKQFFKDRIVYNKDDKGKEHVYAIKLNKDSKWYKEVGLSVDEAYMCVIASSEHIDYAKKYFTLFYETESK